MKNNDLERLEKKEKSLLCFGDWNELTNLCELLGYQLTPRDVSDSIDHFELCF